MPSWQVHYSEKADYQTHISRIGRRGDVQDRDRDWLHMYNMLPTEKSGQTGFHEKKLRKASLYD